MKEPLSPEPSSPAPLLPDVQAWLTQASRRDLEALLVRLAEEL